MDDQQLEILEKETLGETFASAEARLAYERAKRMRTVAKMVLITVIVCSFGIAMYRLGLGKHSDKVDGPPEYGGQEIKIDPVGSPEAKVKVVAVMPAGSDCHSKIVKFLSETAQKHPDKIHVAFFSMQDYGKKKLEGKVGSICAAVMINGKAQFTVPYKGKLLKINLVGTEPTHFTLGDVGEALTYVYKGMYGDPGEPIYTVPKGSEPGGETLATPASEDLGDTQEDEGGGHHSCNGPRFKSQHQKDASDSLPLELPDFKEIKTKP